MVVVEDVDAVGGWLLSLGFVERVQLPMRWLMQLVFVVNVLLVCTIADVSRCRSRLCWLPVPAAAVATVVADAFIVV